MWHFYKNPAKDQSIPTLFRKYFYEELKNYSDDKIYQCFTSWNIFESPNLNFNHIEDINKKYWFKNKYHSYFFSVRKESSLWQKFNNEYYMLIFKKWKIVAKKTLFKNQKSQYFWDNGILSSFYGRHYIDIEKTLGNDIKQNWLDFNDWSDWLLKLKWTTEIIWDEKWISFRINEEPKKDNPTQQDLQDLEKIKEKRRKFILWLNKLFTLKFKNTNIFETTTFKKHLTRNQLKKYSDKNLIKNLDTLEIIDNDFLKSILDIFDKKKDASSISFLLYEPSKALIEYLIKNDLAQFVKMDNYLDALCVSEWLKNEARKLYHPQTIYVNWNYLRTPENNWKDNFQSSISIVDFKKKVLHFKSVFKITWIKNEDFQTHFWDIDRPAALIIEFDYNFWDRTSLNFSHYLDFWEFIFDTHKNITPYYLGFKLFDKENKKVETINVWDVNKKELVSTISWFDVNFLTAQSKLKSILPIDAKTPENISTELNMLNNYFYDNWYCYLSPLNVLFLFKNKLDIYAKKHQTFIEWNTIFNFYSSLICPGFSISPIYYQKQEKTHSLNMILLNNNILKHVDRFPSFFNLTNQFLSPYLTWLFHAYINKNWYIEKQKKEDYYKEVVFNIKDKTAFIFKTPFN